ncbi:hypothetical protein SAMN05216327_101220 [Dyadobacter sp. SG02]|nr:hypothetical protein SAMN05216327_101220 [Dyadobacter sp. SG02]
MLRENQEILLKQTVINLLKEIQDPANSELLHMRQSAFDMFLPETNDSVQVQVTVTRDENDFLDFLETECMS